MVGVTPIQILPGAGNLIAIKGSQGLILTIIDHGRAGFVVAVGGRTLAIRPDGIGEVPAENGLEVRVAGGEGP
ncbi:MAG TPA: hypothetical protein PK336_02765 [Methanoculleus sp.]|nr:hypothetical protein [Methanoculleus sp.]